jgi:hypothetical protein
MSWKFFGAAGVVMFVLIPAVAIFMAAPDAAVEGSGGAEPSYSEYVRWLNNDYYGALGVSRDAAPTDIKKAYRALSMIHHPDKAAKRKPGAYVGVGMGGGKEKERKKKKKKTMLSCLLLTNAMMYRMQGGWKQDGNRVLLID